MKRIAALTMVRNDEFFLRKWVEYYGAQLGKSNLHVYLDGLDQSVPDFCSGVNVKAVEHIEGNVQRADRGRIDFLSARAAELFAQGYEMVIGTDVDEFLIVDPALGQSLPEFLSSRPATRCPSISGLGVDVGQKLGEEEAIDLSRPFLSQRHYARLSTRYSKSTVLLRPVQWGSGFHRTRRGNFHICEGLFLFHFGCVDLERIKGKMQDKGLVDAGWTRHLHKRARTIYQVSERPAREWERTVRCARRMQNVVRSPFAWNKPAMFEAVVIVRIPERFESVI